MNNYNSLNIKTHHYPFGSVMPGRSYSSGGYRYGFNGYENDNEVSGSGNSYTTEYRQYDPRIGRWLSRDALSNKFPFYTPYQFAGNKPIVAVDLDGLEDVWVHAIEQEDGSLLDGGTYLEQGDETNKVLSDALGFKVPPTGSITTILRKSGKLEMVNYSPTFNLIAEKPEAKESNLVIQALNGMESLQSSMMGSTTGELEGERGLIKSNEAAKNVGLILLVTPAAPVGEGILIFTDIVETGLDFKNKSGKEAGINLGIRVATFGLGEGSKSIMNNLTKNETTKRLVDFVVNVGLDKGQNKGVEQSATMNKKDD